MILGISELHKLVKEKKLVENLCDRELNNPEGAGFDLRLGELYKIVGKEGFLGIEERDTPKIELVVQYKEGKNNKAVIKPGEYYLMKTIERVNMPDNLEALFYPRTTLYRSGIFFRAGECSPGYCGELTFALANLGPATITIETGARVAHVVFWEVKGTTNLYRGQWQDGRVGTDGVEKQV